MMAFLFLANIIPNKPIWDHVVRSLPSDNYVMSPGDLVPLDQFTECIAVTVGLTPNDLPIQPIIRAIGSPTLGPCEISHKALTKELGSLNFQPYYYWRYWHGYQILSRPVLALTDTNTLRLLMLLLMCTSFFFLNAIRKTSRRALCIYILDIAALDAVILSILTDQS